MPIPFVIDNREHTLAAVLNDILGRFEHRSLDVATAYFTVGGFKLLQAGLSRLGSFRLLLGAEPGEAADIGLHPQAETVRLQFREHAARVFPLDRLQPARQAPAPTSTRSCAVAVTPFFAVRDTLTM